MTVQNNDGEALVLVAGEIDMETSPVLRSSLLELAQTGVQRITVDMAETDFIDSTGLHALVMAVKELREHGGSLVVRSPSKSAARILELTGLDTMVTVV